MSHPPDLPEIVNRAFDVSRRAGYVSFCRNETGRLLAMLAATRDGTMAEFGTGCGVGTAWLRSGVRGEKARIVTAELDPKLAEAAAEIFRDDDQVEVLAADWSTLLDRGPYSLLFLDSEEPTEVTVDAIADLVEDGGIVVLDDFTPCELWPPITQRPRRHPARALAHRRPLHRRRGDGRPRRLHHHRHQALNRCRRSADRSSARPSTVRIARVGDCASARRRRTSTIQAGSMSWVRGPMARA